MTPRACRFPGCGAQTRELGSPPLVEQHELPDGTACPMSLQRRSAEKHVTLLVAGSWGVTSIELPRRRPHTELQNAALGSRGRAEGWDYQR